MRSGGVGRWMIREGGHRDAGEGVDLRGLLSLPRR